MSIAFENVIESTKDVQSVLLNQSNNRSNSVTLWSVAFFNDPCIVINLYLSLIVGHSTDAQRSFIKVRSNRRNSMRTTYLYCRDVLRGSCTETKDLFTWREGAPANRATRATLEG